jgi:hypothetical protein
MQFADRSLEVFKDSHIGPWFAGRTLERKVPLQCAPWAPASGGPAKFRRGRPGAGGGRIVALFGAEAPPAWGIDDAVVLRPQGAWLRRGKRCRQCASKMRGSRAVLERGW